MGETSPVIVAFVVNKNLGFIFQSSECRGVDDAITVSLKPGSVEVLLFLILASFAFTAFHSVRSKREGFNFFQILPLDQNAT